MVYECIVSFSVKFFGYLQVMLLLSLNCLLVDDPAGIIILCIPPLSARAIVWLPPYVLSHGIWFGAL